MGWRTGRPGMLQSMGLQRVGRDWVTEQLTFSELFTFTYILKIPACLICAKACILNRKKMFIDGGIIKEELTRLC